MHSMMMKSSPGIGTSMFEYKKVSAMENIYNYT